jgi:hypothetical protein
MKAKVLLPVLAIFVAAAPTFADDIYRWVDSNGQAHYSDMPLDGAELVDLSPAQTYTAPGIAASSSAGRRARSEPESAYESFSIVSPSEEETIWNTGGVITVSVRPSPALRPGHSISISYDGRIVTASQGRETSVRLSDMYRGEHRISAEIRDRFGNRLMSAPTVTFFYRQTSVNN